MLLDASYFIEKSALLKIACKNSDFMEVVQSIDWMQYQKSFMAWIIGKGGLEQILEQSTDEANESLLEFGSLDSQLKQALREGDLQKGCFHFAVFKSLLSAMLESGSGTSCEDAIYVTSTSDEYYFLHNVKKLKMQDQSLVEKDGRSYDIINAVDRRGKESVWYFDVTDVMQSY